MIAQGHRYSLMVRTSALKWEKGRNIGLSLILLFLFVDVLRPSNMDGHMSMGSELVTVRTQGEFISLPHCLFGSFGVYVLATSMVTSQLNMSLSCRSM